MWFCSFLQRFRPNMRESAQSFTESFLAHSKGLIHTPTSLLSVANNCCFEIRSLSENRWQETHKHNRKSGSAFFTVNKNAFSLLIAYPTWPVQLFQVIKVSGLNYACLAMNATKGSTRFVLNFLLNKDSHQKKLIFLLWGIVMESTGLEVARKQVEDVETEHCKTWVSISSHQLFSCFCIIKGKKSVTYLL